MLCTVLSAILRAWTHLRVTAFLGAVGATNSSMREPVPNEPAFYPQPARNPLARFFLPGQHRGLVQPLWWITSVHDSACWTDVVTGTGRTLLRSSVLRFLTRRADVLLVFWLPRLNPCHVP